MVFPFKYSINLKSSILRLLHVPSSNVSAPACVSIQAPLYSLCCLYLLILTLCIFKWKISRKPRLFDWYPFFGFDKKPRQSHFHLRPAPHICSRRQLPEPRRIRRREKLTLAQKTPENLYLANHGILTTALLVLILFLFAKSKFACLFKF